MCDQCNTVTITYGKAKQDEILIEYAHSIF